MPKVLSRSCYLSRQWVGGYRNSRIVFRQVQPEREL